ncbi:unnamed protein product [Caenorhabditis auriculariae]|uniref:Uncharacterized protein n=1 Tax=Caenorhabditis auriculariae TaxID=2777116 RepID=A0A8S1HYG2_9PELO|nr:unnamed protein product [Caenorhabditis auriculariae]
MAKDMKISRSSMERILKDKLKLTCYHRTRTEEHLVTVFSDEKLITVQAEFNPQNHRVLAKTSDEAFGNGRTIHRASHPASVMVFRSSVC